MSEENNVTQTTEDTQDKTTAQKLIQKMFLMIDSQKLIQQRMMLLIK